MSTLAAPPVARVNGVALHEPGEAPSPQDLRQRACTELLRQEARAAGFDAATDPQAIEALLEREVGAPEPGEDACRRWFDANPARFARGERLALRHILFGVTPGVDVAALRHRAEALLLELRCEDAASGAFAAAAAAWSNCPSGAKGGELGWITSEDCAEEFARQVFAQQVVGILPRLVHSRFGFHVVEVRGREPGIQPAFEDVAQAIALRLRHQTWAAALRAYLRRLAARARVEGVDLDAATTPLVQ